MNQRFNVTMKLMATRRMASLNKSRCIERVKNAIGELDITKIERRMNRYRSDLLIDDFNLIEWMISIFKLYEDNDETQEFLNAFNLVCSIIPQRITDRIAHNLTLSNEHQLLKIIFKYKLEDDDDNQCRVCMSSFKVRLLKTPCHCNDHIHLSCLNDLVRNSGNKCRICKSSYGCLSIAGTLFYPRIDIYPDPVYKKNYAYVTSDLMRLRLAIMYVRVDRVIELLDSMEIEQLKEYVETADYENLHEVRNGNLMLKDKLYSGVTRSMYPDDFELIEVILNSKLENWNIQVTQKSS